ncbi:hypothetical protein GALL_454230 [mine drainage metagenome]|uniref:Uncharacterized protein n=1 Tax=mine drainage metagenome TaxID=410659 RepID=A0A1J5PQ64_9ZZZZ
MDIHDKGTIGLFHVEMAAQGFQRRHLAELRLADGMRFEPEQAEQRRRDAIRAAAELRILVETSALDHLQQDAVGGNQACLAFHHHRQAGGILGARREFAVDQLQLSGIDIELRGRQIFWCQALADSDGCAGADQSGDRNRGLPPPQQLR